MFYENEISLICDTFRKFRINADIVSPDDKLKSVIRDDFLHLVGSHSLGELSVNDYFSAVKHNTMYKFTDPFRCRYISFLLPSTSEEKLFVLGPYIHHQFTDRDILEIGENNNISPMKHKNLEEYCASIPIIDEDSHMFFVLDTFCEHIWSNTSFTIVDVEKESLMPASPINEEQINDFDDVLINMKKMEKRYEYENELMLAVTNGQAHKANHFFAGFNEDFFEKRTTDLLRNYKNYCIIMNTLLRKAAENGGVHPMYLDRVSSSFANRIEHLNSNSEVLELMKEMFSSYCRLTKKHSMKSYSQLVQNTITIIDSDLSSNLTLSSLASAQNVSSGYLATVFKKDTGKTISEYIREKRLNHASYLLRTTHLQIQTVALHCGIMDVQYFSKQFKKFIGKSPKEYRESMKHSV